MANEIDNILLSDDTTGLARTIDVGVDDLVLSTDLTLQAGGILVADNIKRGTGDPNGVEAGNEGDLFQRTDAAAGTLYVNTDGTNTGWSEVDFVGGTPTLSQVLTSGNTTGGTDIEITSGDSIVGQPLGGPISITAGSNTGFGGNGGNVNISAGAGGPLGLAGDLVLATQGLPAEPGDIQFNSSGAVLINPASDSTVQVNGSSVLQFNERASLAGPPAIAAGEGRIWVRDDAPNNLIYTDDTASDRLVVAPPGSPATGDLVYYDGADWVRLSLGTEGQALTAGASDPQWAGPKRYPNSATNPVSPAPAAGDIYYNTALQMQVQYDGSRSKWLSVASDTFAGSDLGALTSGTYLQVGSVRMTATRGYTAQYNGTIVALGYTRTDSDASSWQVTSNGSTIATVATSATSGQSNSLDANFNQGNILGIRNGGVNAMSNTIVWVRVKWRV